MRSEKEMLDLIVGVASGDPRIRAAYLEGSRANPNVPKDIFQDYDVGYVVEETGTFIEDRGWIDRFGERLYLQIPEQSAYDCADTENCYGWLMQFSDGNRLDLHVRTAQNALENLELYRTLLDKDGILPKVQELSDERYWVSRPTQEQFLSTCNEFWWCLNNVAKGLWREELPYVMDMLDFNVRPMLRRLLEWEIGMEHNFAVNVGKSAKNLGRYLPTGRYEQYLQTYPVAQVSAIWKSVFTMCGLFDTTAQKLRQGLGFSYDEGEAENSRGFLQHVQNLPPDARGIY